MNCNLTGQDRKNGMRCRSWDCRSCLEFNTSKNDVKIIDTHMENMLLKKEIASLKEELKRERECVDFYASKEIYYNLNRSFEYKMIKHDLEEIEGMPIRVAGKFARQTVAQRKEKIGE